jgi:hypothetical protein
MINSFTWIYEDEVRQESKLIIIDFINAHVCPVLIDDYYWTNIQVLAWIRDGKRIVRIEIC